MKLTPGEIVDRYSIARLKFQRLPETEANRAHLEACQSALPARAPTKLVQDLIAVNTRIWDLEAGLQDPVLELDEVGRRALDIRRHNSHRVELKNKINVELGHPQEVKNYAAKPR